MAKRDMDLVVLGLQIVKAVLLLTVGEVRNWTFTCCGRRWCVETHLHPCALEIRPLDH